MNHFQLPLPPPAGHAHSVEVLAEDVADLPRVFPELVIVVEPLVNVLPAVVARVRVELAAQVQVQLGTGERLDATSNPKSIQNKF